MARIFNLFINFIFIVVIVVLAGYFVLRATGKIEIYNVKTGSMEDKIHVGDYILIYRKGDYHIGDVVTFKKEGGYITHRIVNMDGNRITTKGDANNTTDDDIDISIVEGKVIMSGGALNAIINYKYGIVGILLSLYLLSCYFGNGKDDKGIVEDDKDTSEEKKEMVEEVIDSSKNEDVPSINEEITVLDDEFNKQIIENNDIEEKIDDIEEINIPDDNQLTTEDKTDVINSKENTDEIKEKDDVKIEEVIPQEEIISSQSLEKEKQEEIKEDVIPIKKKSTKKTTAEKKITPSKNKKKTGSKKNNTKTTKKTSNKKKINGSKKTKTVNKPKQKKTKK